MRWQGLALRHDEWQSRLAALRGTFLKWDADVEGRSRMPPGALVLDAAEHREVVAAAERIAAACAAAQAQWPRRPPFGLPRGVDGLAAAGPAGDYVTRIDLFPTRDGWKASECNDDVPGGHNEAIGLPALLEPDLPDGLRVPGDLPDAMARLVGAAPGLRLGIAYATAYAEDLQVVALLARLWEAAGAEVVLAAPDRLSLAPAGVPPRREGDPGQGGAARADGSGPALVLDGARVDRVFRFFPAEWFPGLPSASLAAWRAAAAAGLVTNPLACAWTQSKLAFAHLPGIDPGLRGLLPATGLLDEAAAAEVQAERSRYVLKPCFGRMGAAVAVGHESDAAAWGKAVRNAVRQQATAPFVWQHRFHPTGVEVAPGDVRTPCVGAYVVGGRFAGYYTRLAQGPVVAHHADNVLTVVEGA